MVPYAIDTRSCMDISHTYNMAYMFYKYKHYNTLNLFGVFEILKDKDKFKEVFIDEFGNIAWERDKNVDSNKVWNNKIEVCKDSVYMNSKPLGNTVS